MSPLALPAFRAELQIECAGACTRCSWRDSALTIEKPVPIGCPNCFQSQGGKACLAAVCNAYAAQGADMRKELFKLFGPLGSPLPAFNNTLVQHLFMYAACFITCSCSPIGAG